MNETKHTPTPWEHVWNGTGGHKITGTIPFLSGEAEVLTVPGIAFDIRRENAAYIVKACNLFPALVEALKSSKVYMEGCPLDYGGDEGIKLLERVISLIDKAKE